ncbi:MAG: hypothetical protein JXA25_07480 [Anaerolineales bacterium]|nr:hypothetical protein [Anaerolineales bacterium]
MRLLIQTAEQVLLDRDNITHIRLPVSDGGSIGVRQGHHPLIGELARGRVIFTEDENKEEMAIEPGLVQIEKNLVTIFTSGWLNPANLQGSAGQPESRRRLTESLLERYGKP